MASGETCARSNSETRTLFVRRKHEVDQLSDVDYVPTLTHILLKVSLNCTFFEDNEAVTQNYDN